MVLDVLHDPAYCVVVDDDEPARRRAVESLLTLADGRVGVRGGREEPDPDAAPLVLAAGTYAGVGPEEHLLEGPWPLTVRYSGGGHTRWLLDLRSATLTRETDGELGTFRTLRFLPASCRGAVLMRAEGPRKLLRPGPPVRRVTSRVVATGALDGVTWGRTVGDHGSIAVGVCQRRLAPPSADRVCFERAAAFAAAPDATVAPRRTASVLERVRTRGFDALLAEHRARWARRWDDVDVEIPDDRELERAVRFALFHLWSSVGDSGEAAVGARGLSGGGYAGHVFWDADVFVLPAIATMHPGAARAMLEYRIRRLPEARREARARGLDGARFPWESATFGADVTPTSARLAGVWTPILTGQLEEHIVGDVAWAAARYAELTGDCDFLRDRGRPLLTETARYWAGRAETDADGSAHLRSVIGPDEYHEAVDDNCFTNVLARWNLRRGADLEPCPATATAWRELADRLVDGYDPATHRHEQFTGYYDLEPVLAAEVGAPPLPADLLLGAERVSASQLIKQPDVLMAHHMLPDQLPPVSLEPDIAFYLPRTTHGSSLSPGISAAVLAAAGRPDEALPLFRLAARIDLDDLTGSTSSGLHVGTMGSLWQALLFGFAGVRVSGAELLVRPQLPSQWRRLRLRFRCLGRRIRLDIDPDVAVLTADSAVGVRTRRDGPVVVGPEVRLVRDGQGWEVAQ